MKYNVHSQSAPDATWLPKSSNILIVGQLEDFV